MGQSYSLREQFQAVTGSPYLLSYRRGPLPWVARQAAVALTDELTQMPDGGLRAIARAQVAAESARLRLARLLDAPGGLDEIAFFRCTTDAIAAVAAGLSWRDGDEVLISDREYPANVYPWFALQRHGVKVNMVRADAAGRLPVEAFREALTARTRLVACSSVYFTTGWRMDVPALAGLCREWGALLLVDAVQSIGSCDVSVRHWGADVVAGDARKFLCGLDGAGFMWATPELIERLQPVSVGAMSVANAGNYLDYDFSLRRDARRFEPGGQPSVSLAALDASLKLWEAIGLAHVGTAIDALVDRLLHAARDVPGIEVVSDYPPAHRSALVALRATDPATMQARRDAADRARVQCGLRDTGEIMLSPHAFNTADDIDAAVRHVLRPA
ncbi:MAG: aminotransferase class V-fold PLP-dependent enzyme [Planctomycetota bacterium]